MNLLSHLRKPFRYEFLNVTLYLIGANLLVFFLTYLNRGLLYYMALNPLYLLKGGMVWQLVSYMFAHASFNHILFNMLGLFFFGLQVEREMGSREFLLFYFFTGIFAGLVSLLVYWLSGAYGVFLLGASGVVYGVLLAFATFYPRARIFLFGIFPVPAPYLVIGYTAIELLAQFGAQDNVAHLTHLAGFAGAYLYLVLRLGISPFRVFRNEYFS
ncbi:Rhomboid family protein [Spirochaeta thermophila DSM 6578]|uniref:Rhomboid family protein n=1 Tax=Winmispira thermophila (strain ATCC 700085 / DSM 6578 / Z-1203) TaxID=869211 RepID=G0GFZ8_WINT7|nr:rhomboid family intramembrane serine protease [Spirochaeta thermophila]AEJ62474.1 Rhomboid family protein [Spirochaeta thermophila DSM 6578]